MTIEMSFMRPIEEGGVLEEVERWQNIRSLSRNEVQVKALITKIQEVDINRRLLLKSQNEKRARMNHLKRLLSPKVKDLDNCEVDASSIKNEVRNLKSEIPSISKKLQEITVERDGMFARLGNSVDETALPTNDSNRACIKRHLVGNPKECTLISDPLLCIGGCETLNLSISIGQSKKATTTKEKFVLTGVGSEIMSALISYTKEFFLKCEIMADASVVHLPNTMAIPPDIAHSALGCSRGHDMDLTLKKKETIESLEQECHICLAIANDEEVSAPPYITFALMNQNKTYSERELPKISLCPTQSVESSMNMPFKSRFTHHFEQIEILALAVSNIHISRALQEEIAQRMVEFFISLLCENMDSDQRIYFHSNVEKDIVRLRLAEAHVLDADECRRICVQGYLPSQKKHVELCRISNCTSFVSRSFKIKCGIGNIQGTEFVHLLRGIIFQEPSIAWMLENNIVSVGIPNADAKEQIGGVMIPPTLVSYMPHSAHNSPKHECAMMLPFQRELAKGKGGKVRLKELAKKYNPIFFLNNNARGEERSNEDSESKTAPNNRTPRPNSLSAAAAEAICNPWDFLPLYRS